MSNTTTNTNETMKNFLSTLKYVTIEPVGRIGKPNAAVRQNGQIVFSAAANEIIGFPANQYFKAGGDAIGNIYLVPATAETPNVIKGTKNNESMQFRQDNVLASLGAEYKDRYVVSKEVDGEGDAAVTYFKLTKLSKAEAEAEAKAEEPAEPAKEEAPAKNGKAKK